MAPRDGLSYVSRPVHYDPYIEERQEGKSPTTALLREAEDVVVDQPGVDLGWSRLDAALHYSPEAADEIVLGWTQEAGRRPDSLAYWDTVAALQTDADIGEFTTKPDDFLRAALSRIGR